MNRENPTVRPIAMSRDVHQRRCSLTRHATLSAVMMDSIPLDAAHSAAKTPIESRPPLAPLTISASVRLSSDAASLGSMRSA